MGAAAGANATVLNPSAQKEGKPRGCSEEEGPGEEIHGTHAVRAPKKHASGVAGNTWSEPPYERQRNLQTNANNSAKKNAHE